MTKYNALVGYTGFVGSNILSHNKFDFLYDAKNIEEIRNKEFKLMVVAAAPGVKWLANQKPEEDLTSINRLINELSSVKAEKLVLISTIDVYSPINGVNEDSKVNKDILEPYGKHRRMLEEFIVNKFNCTIVRLPGLFGTGLKKNIIYDYMHNAHTSVPKDNIFQFYYLNNIWKDINIALENNIGIINFATEPIPFKELEKEIFGQEFFLDSNGKIVFYDMQTKYAHLWMQKGNYLYSKQQILEDLKKFVESNI